MLKKQEIIDFALQYINEKDIVDFPDKGEVFFLKLETVEPLNDDEGNAVPVGTAHPVMWGVCTGYSLDYECKPEGKWLYMLFTSLRPSGAVVLNQSFRLQPPHIAMGEWFEPGRRFKYVLTSFNMLQTSAQMKSLKEPLKYDLSQVDTSKFEQSAPKFEQSAPKVKQSVPTKECKFFEFPKK